MYEPEPDYPREMFLEAVRSQLGTIGDAIEGRARQCLREAAELLDRGYWGPSLTVTVTAVELMIRFMLVQPIVGSAFLSEDWASILFGRVLRRVADDRELLPTLLRQVGLEITALKGETGEPVWQSLVEAIRSRDRFVHAAEPPSQEIAANAIRWANCFREFIEGSFATALGFTLGTTGRWSEIRTAMVERRFGAWDPIARAPFRP